MGRYEIKYTVEQLGRRAERESVNLVVRVFDRDNLPLASSKIIFDAQPVETVNLTVRGELQVPSQYEELLKELAPALHGTPLKELNEFDITLLAGTTGIDPQLISTLVESAKLAQETGIPAEAFHGWFRQNLPTSLPALWSRPTDELVAALKTAVERNIVPRQMRERLEALAKELKRRKLDETLRPAPDSAPASLGDLLETMWRPLLEHAPLVRQLQEVAKQD